jgi:hypothetical protein
MIKAAAGDRSGGVCRRAAMSAATAITGAALDAVLATFGTCDGLAGVPVRLIFGGRRRWCGEFTALPESFRARREMESTFRCGRMAIGLKVRKVAVPCLSELPLRGVLLLVWRRRQVGRARNRPVGGQLAQPGQRIPKVAATVTDQVPARSCEDLPRAIKPRPAGTAAPIGSEGWDRRPADSRAMLSGRAHFRCFMPNEPWCQPQNSSPTACSGVPTDG